MPYPIGTPQGNNGRHQYKELRSPIVYLAAVSSRPDGDGNENFCGEPAQGKCAK